MNPNTETSSTEPHCIDHPFRSRVSATAVRTFETCPKAYVLKYLDRKQAAKRSSMQLAVGNAIHQALEKFFGLPREHRTLDDLHKCLRSIWHLHRAQAGFATREEEAQCGRGALEMLSRFFMSFSTEERPLAREEWIETRPLETGLRGFGKVDRIDAPDDAEGLVVIDYKTGRVEIDPVDLPDDRAAQLYLIGTTEDFGEPVDSIRYVYLQSGSEVVWRPEAEDLERARDSLELVTAEMLHARDMEATPGEHCKFCDFRRICPESSATDVADLEVPIGIPF